jgi:hypothetical protein
MRVAAARPRTAAAPAVTWRQALLYHAGLAAFLVIAVAAGLPLLIVAAFAPILARAFYYIVRPTRELNLKQVGWTEVVYSLWFLLCASVALRTLR